METIWFRSTDADADADAGTATAPARIRTTARARPMKAADSDMRGSFKYGSFAARNV